MSRLSSTSSSDSVQSEGPRWKLKNRRHTMVQNPLAPLFNTARQLNEQVNLSTRALSDSLAQSANSILAAAATAVPGAPGAPAAGAGVLALPPLPLLPGIAAAPGGSSNPGRSGNPNGAPAAAPVIPTLAQLFPAGTVQAFTSVDDVIFPRGFPSPARVLLGTLAAPAAPAAPTAIAAAPVATRGAVGVEGTPRGVAARRASRAVGVAAT